MAIRCVQLGCYYAYYLPCLFKIRATPCWKTRVKKVTRRSPRRHLDTPDPKGLVPGPILRGEHVSAIRLAPKATQHALERPPGSDLQLSGEENTQHLRPCSPRLTQAKPLPVALRGTGRQWGSRATKVREETPGKAPRGGVCRGCWFAVPWRPGELDLGVPAVARVSQNTMPSSGRVFINHAQKQAALRRYMGVLVSLANSHRKVFCDTNPTARSAIPA